MQEKLDSIMHAHWDVDASNARALEGRVQWTHQHLSASALLYPIFRATSDTHLLTYFIHDKKIMRLKLFIKKNTIKLSENEDNLSLFFSPKKWINPVRRKSTARSTWNCARVHYTIFMHWRAASNGCSDWVIVLGVYESTYNFPQVGKSVKFPSASQ